MTTTSVKHELPDDDGAIKFDVYPNPTRGKVHLDIQATDRDGGAEVVLTDVFGRMVSVVHESWLMAGSTILVPLPRVSPGVYWIQIRSEAGSYTRRGLTITG